VRLRLWHLAWILLPLAVSPGVATATSEHFVFPLSGQLMVPPRNSSLPHGAGDLSLELETHSLHGFLDLGVLTGPVRSIRICGPAGSDENAPILYNIGTTRHVLLTGLTRQQVAQLQAERWYVEICTGTYPDGEVRGQITHAPTAVTPSVWGAVKALYGSAP
jgi:hypothetical protein